VSGSTSKRSDGRGWKVALGVVVGLILIAVVAYGVDYFANKDKVPRGTTVGGVEIGGMDKAEASQTLQAELGGVETDPVSIAAGDLTSQLIPAESGLGIDWDATVAAAGESSANPLVRISGLFTTREVDVVSQTDEAALNPQLDRVAGELFVAPADGAVGLEDGEVRVTDPVVGQEVDRAELQEEVTDGWLDPAGVEVEALPLEPAINQDVVDDAANGPAAEAVSGPLVLSGDDEVDGVIEPARIGEFVAFLNEDGAIRPDVDVEAATVILDEQLAVTETESINAQILSDGSITPHQDGRAVDWETTMDGFVERVLGDEPREWGALYEDDPAGFTTEMAQNAEFNQVMGEFTTSGYSTTSGQNIAVIVGDVSGAIVAPGEVFSLNEFTGPRGTAQGYVEGGIIEDGRAGTAVGGGISQFATTLYNAYYFAGLEDVTHTPHSYYISRYPAGREATVYEGAIDLAFRNQTDVPVRIEASVGGGSLTVRIMGVDQYNVESVNGGRWAATQPREMSVSGSECIPSSGNPGFTTSDTRIVRDKAGNEVSRNTETTVYDPQPIVRCTG
jgi:vancomycin resistance protein YoaR